MALKPDSHTMIKRLVPPLALWVTTKILDTPKVKGALADVDAHTHHRKRAAARSIKRAGKNARRNRGWVAASAAALVVAIGFMARASSKR